MYIGESLNIKERIRSHKRSKDQIIHKAIKKYGIVNFDIYVEYLPNFKKEDLLDIEEILISKHNSIRPNGYNLAPRGNLPIGYKHTDESKKKMSEARKGRTVSDETKKKISMANKGNKMQPHTKEALYKANFGSKWSEDRKKSFSLYRTGKSHSEESKQKLSNSKMGKPRSQELKDKLSIIAKNRIHITCPHCNKTCDPVNAKRWHFDSCKFLIES